MVLGEESGDLIRFAERERSRVNIGMAHVVLLMDWSLESELPVHPFLKLSLLVCIYIRGPYLQACSFAAMSDSVSTPVSADFSSSPPKRTKIVLLGDQSVGKTSLITRWVSLLQTAHS